MSAHRTPSATLEITPERARDWMVGHLGLRRPSADVGTVLEDLRCIQLDPLSAIGTNADLVAMARVDGLKLGEVYRVAPSFEHFFKERCLLPATAFPYYAGRSVQTPWWRLRERHRKLPKAVVEAVYAHVRDHGPLTSRELPDFGRVAPIDWHGWKSTSKAGTMALEVLWTRCRIVVAGRRGRDKLWDLPSRALPETTPVKGFQAWSVRERCEAAGLMAMGHPQLWSALKKRPTRSVVSVRVSGSRRIYLAPRGFLDRAHAEDDGRMRILGPLDPLIWDRKLVEHIWGFTYRWEVYTPPAKRRWGWYVCPLLHEGRLVGRLKAHIEGGEVVVDQLWREPGFSDQAFQACLNLHNSAV